MRKFGYLLIALGVLCLVVALAMDVTVSSGAGRVNNIGLMSERQNLILISGFMLLIGIVVTVVGNRQSELAIRRESTRSCPVCAEDIQCAAIKCKHCGSSVESVSGVAKVLSSETIQSTKEERRQLLVARIVMYSLFVCFIAFALLHK